MILFRKAILVIHGYAGGTYDLEPLSNCLEKRWNLDVFSFTLPGHKKRSSKAIAYEEWINESEKQLKNLIDYGYKNIYVIGHSMGGVIASYLASKYKCVKKLVLVAPAFRYLVNEDNVNLFGLLKKGIGVVKKADTGEAVTRLLKLPLLSIGEFQKLVDEYREYIYDVSIPILIVQGNDDELVPKESIVEIFKKLKGKHNKIKYIENTTHNVFDSMGSNEAIKVIEKFLI